MGGFGGELGEVFTEIIRSKPGVERVGGDGEEDGGRGKGVLKCQGTRAKTDIGEGQGVGGR